VSNLFGLTAQETAGLSAALATLQVRPELSRGALTRVFNDLTLAVSDGGTELSKLAKVMGITDEEATKLFNNPATRGDFLLSFIEGLSGAAGAGGDVQGVLRELGVNAVRDIDVFSRLANNFDVVSESFDKANVEFARGTELNRQSKGIYETTSAEIQNLSDAFKTLLATLGGPLATAVGAIAARVANLIGSLAHLGPIVPIVGTLTAVAIAGVAGWALYQVALAKTIQSLIATRELQKNLQVTTLNLSTAIGIYRGKLGEANVISAQATQAANSQATATGRLALSVQRATGAYSANLISNERAAIAATQQVAASGAQLRANASLLPGFRAYAIATDQAANASQRLAASTLAAVPSTRGLGLAATLTGTSLQREALATEQAALAQTSLTTGTFASTNSMRQQAAAATLAANQQRGLATAMAQSNASIVAAAATSGKAATAIASTGRAAAVARFAFGPWGLAISAVAILLGPFIGQLFDFRTEAEKIADSALQAKGGTEALANAIKADTDAAVTAAGSLERYNSAVKDGSAQALGAIGVYRTVTTQKTDLAEADQKSAEAARAAAREQIKAIEATKGSKEQLQEQAKGHGDGANAARRYLNEIARATDVVNQSTDALGENTAAIGENVKQWLLDTAQATLEQSKLADGSERSAEALKQLSQAGVDVGDILTKSLSDPKAAVADLDAALKTVGVTADTATIALAGKGGGVKTFDETALAAQRLEGFLGALKTVIEAESDESTKASLAKQLLTDALDTTGESAASASGKIKLTKASLEDLETTGEEAQQAIDQLGEGFTKFGTPLDAFSAAAKSAFGDAEDAVSKFSLNSKSGLNSYLKELEKIAKAQRDWSTNLIKISATLGPEIAAQFQKLGPEAAPAIAELADLSAAELAKLGPRLAEIGGDATSDLAAAIIANSGKIENATLQTRTVIANLFGNLVNKTKTASDFATVSNQYTALVTKLSSLKGVNIDITANQAKALKSLQDVSLFIDLVGKKKISPEIAIDIVKARGDIAKLQAIIAEAEADGSLDPKGAAQLETVLFHTQLTKLTADVKAIIEGGQIDPFGHADLNPEQYRKKVLELTQFLASVEGQGLLNPQGDAQLHDKAYRAQMESLARLILGDERAGKFDVDGSGDLDDKEFKALLQGLKDAVGRANRGQLDPKGRVTLANTSGFRGQLGGIVQAAQRAGSQITQALNRSAQVSVGYYYYQKNSPPPSSMKVATGGWINGPGGPKTDSIPAMLSNGEFVVNAAAASRFGALLEVINRSGGRGFSGVAKKLLDAGSTGGSKQVRLATNTGNTALNAGQVQQVPPESISVFTTQMAMPQQGPTNVFNINNQYPQAEPTSTTINRSLAYAATISGV